MQFKLASDFTPRGDQPQAIEQLVSGIRKGAKNQTLLGITGSGKTFTMANVIQQIQMPTLVISHNKTLAAQLFNEFKTFFPQNAVEYFVSFYDYYQPEAYIPSSDTYIEKDSQINDEIDRLRLKATSSLLSRSDVIIVASVSCIYNIGSPESYAAASFKIERGMQLDRRAFFARLVDMRYTRNDTALGRGTFRVRGDSVDLMPAYDETGVRFETFGDQVERISRIHPVSGNTLQVLDDIVIFPARHFVASRVSTEAAIGQIYHELENQLADFKARNKLVEAQRLEERTNYDMEMLREVGFVSGIENYSRVLDGRPSGSRPYCLIDFFKRPFLTIIDESHVTIPQVNGMYNGDRARKTTLVEHGFRLPSALDNRPLVFNEFEELTDYTVYVSATPADYELKRCGGVFVEQVIRPTGLIDPPLEVRPARNQVDDLIEQLRVTVKKGHRALVTTLTKKMSEDLTDYLAGLDFKVQYLHSEIDTLERPEILRNLRLGKFDILVGINLLREGLDLPEVALVAILDADKEGFLRSYRSIIQIAGRAARNVDGAIILYADTITASIRKAIDECNRRREKQVQYNLEHGIVPQTIKRSIEQSMVTLDETAAAALSLTENPPSERGARRKGGDAGNGFTIAELERRMHALAANLEFEKAARLRDLIASAKKKL
ncbi:MAG: excinuclease ABC subunit UvrB [Chitinivibrionales bacterium]|nr:excinuclease ABC subunit UvrB [Chitinivibrionales bacterium]